MGVKRIIEQAYHRNGIGGAPFVVTLFESDGEPGTFVAISFQTRQGFESRDEAVADFRDHTAVLNVEETANLNVAFACGNSWRGADHYGLDIAQAWTEKCKAEFADTIGGYDPFTEFLTPEATARIETAEREAKQKHLARLEAAFEAHGGRGIEMAEEIDRIRAELDPEPEDVEVAPGLWVPGDSIAVDITEDAGQDDGLETHPGINA